MRSRVFFCVELRFFEAVKPDVRSVIRSFLRALVACFLLFLCTVYAMLFVLMQYFKGLVIVGGVLWRVFSSIRIKKDRLKLINLS